MPSSSSNGGGGGDGPRYAPEDPTLPEPWRGLVDGSTGYLYYWNPVTNVTQYEKPVKEKKRLPAPPPLLPPPPKKSVSSSVHVSSRRRGRDGDDGNGGCYSDEDGSRSKRDHHQGSRHSSSHTLHSSADIGRGHGSKTSSRVLASSDAGAGLSSDAYRCQHEITITGDDIPPPYTTFESTGFPSEILKEVRYLLQAGANVVRCAAFCCPLWVASI